MGDDHTQVTNPQRTWLANASTSLAPSFDALRDCLTPGETAIGAGAWTGKVAQQWEHEFAGRLSQLRTGAQGVRDDLSDLIATLPTTVCSCQIPFGGGYGGNQLFTALSGYPTVYAQCSES